MNESAPNPRDTFLNAVNIEINALEEAGRLTPEQASAKRESAALIEDNFSADPAQDALLFSRAGIADEAEMLEILNKEKAV